MSLDDPTPTEYFGPHAKRWTDPDTGATLSLTPRDYYRAIAKEQLQREKEVQERLLQESVSAAWNDEALDDHTTADKEWKAVTNGKGTVYDESWPRVISMDTMSAEPGWPLIMPEEAELFKKKGELIDRNQAETKQVLAKVNEDLSTITGAKISSTHLEISADGIKPLTVEGANLLERGRVRYLSLVEDDSLGIIRPVEQTAPGKPAARHFRRRKIGRNTLRLGLLYIIAVIGVIFVAVEVL